MSTTARFRTAYAQHRASEGRGSGGPAELLALPFLTTGPWARQWAVRARTYARLLETVIEGARRDTDRMALSILDLGAGNGWLCYRLAQQDHHPLALDWRSDAVDGLSAGSPYRGHLRRMFPRVAASFEHIPLASARFDVVLFNASLHYTPSLAGTLAEARRVTAPGGRIAILDSPFYDRDEDGNRMVAEKHRHMAEELGPRAGELLALRSIEYLTAERLVGARVPGLGSWRRHRVRYPLWYEWRGIAARLAGRRRPSRFDLWEAAVS